MDLYITVAIIAIGIFLFVKDVFSIDTTSILIMALFIVSGVLNPEEGFSGFNHPATLTLGCMFVVSAAVFKSGIIDGLSNRIVRVAKVHYIIALVIFCLISALFSAFVNDSAVVAILIPLALSVCRETGISPSRLLIPISFSALFGGTCTLIGTSTNILVSSIADKAGLDPFGMFEFSMPALCLMAIGFVYLFVFSPLLLPHRSGLDEAFLKESEKYAAEVILLEGNKDVSTAVENTRLVKDFGAQILAIIRQGRAITYFDRNTVLQQDDILKVLLSAQKLGELKNSTTYKISGHDDDFIGEKDERKLFEVMVPTGSDMAGNSLKKMHFRTIYGLAVLAIRHRNEVITQNISDVRIKEGDMVLLYGRKQFVDNLVAQKSMILLSEYNEKKINYRKAIPAIIIAVGVVTAAALNITSILISAMVGSLLLVTTSILKPKEAYEAIEWKVIFMMAGVLSMGTALEKTGGAELISQFVFENLGDLDTRIILSLVFLITFLSTNVLSSKATAALMAPIVISLSMALEVSYKPLLVAVMFACSLTFMTPVSYPTNTMIYAPGNYKFTDFLKIGTPLNVIIWIAASFIIPLFFPF